MDNLKLPASPFFEATENGYGNAVCIYDVTGGKQILPFSPGFTKLEKAALMITQGLAASNFYVIGMHSEHPAIAETAVSLAKAVLEAANK